MKTFGIIYLAVLVATVAGTPHPRPDAAADAAAMAEPVPAPDSNIFEDKLAKRAQCYHRSKCGWYDWNWCKNYCYNGWHANASYMYNCGSGYKQCCCSS